LAVKASVNGDGGKRYGQDTPAAIARRGSAEFLPSFAALQEAVRRACSMEAEWEARVAAAIRAALEFAAAEPVMAHALIVQGRRERSGDQSREQEVVAYFAGQLREVAAVRMRVPISTEEGIIEAIAAVARGHLQAADRRQLLAAIPNLVYLTLVPYVGLDSARHWSDSVALAGT
jgi:hypothetical protein